MIAASNARLVCPPKESAAARNREPLCFKMNSGDLFTRFRLLFLGGLGGGRPLGAAFLFVLCRYPAGIGGPLELESIHLEFGGN